MRSSNTLPESRPARIQVLLALVAPMPVTAPETSA